MAHTLVLNATKAHSMLHDSPTYQAFIGYHGRWVTIDKAAKMVRTLQQVTIEAAREQVIDWLATDEIILDRSKRVNVASLFLAMGY